MALQTANDALIAFSQALSAPGDSEQQITILASVRNAIEAQPHFLPALYSTILSVAARAGNVLVRWIADIVELVVARLGVTSNALSGEQRTHMVIQSADAILLFLESSDLEVHKLGIQCFAAAYPSLFRQACSSPSDPRPWEKAVRAKATVLTAWRTGDVGARVVAMKAIQKIIQAQTKGSADPRLQNRGDVNLAMCPSHHPFLNGRVLEDEATKLTEEAVSLLYSASIPDIVSSIINSMSLLIKVRPTLSSRLFNALTSWAPSTMTSSNATQVRSVEKTLRLALVHLLRSGHGNSYAQQVNDCLQRQDQRMRLAHEAEHRRREEEAPLKRARVVDELSTAGEGDFIQAKRRKLEGTANASTPTPPPGILPPAERQELQTQMALIRQAFANAAATAVPQGIRDYDVTQISAVTVLELVIANLQVMTEDSLRMAIDRAREGMGPAAHTPLGGGEPVRQTDSAAIDPLKLEVDEDDLEGRARDAEAREKKDKAALAAAEAEAEAEAARDESGIPGSRVGPTSLSVDNSKGGTDSAGIGMVISEKAKIKLLHTAINRICTVGIASGAAVQAGGGNKDLWLQLTSRLATRGLVEGTEQTAEVAAEKEAIRKQIFDYVTGDLAERIDLAKLWLNEEWYTTPSGDQSEADTAALMPVPPAYEKWLRKLLDAISTSSIDKEKSTAFSQFFIDLPSIPKSEMQRVGAMCTQPQTLKIGFLTLRDLAMLRPPLRQAAIDLLLALATHPNKPTRNTAILTMKKWINEVDNLAQAGLDFALYLLKRLETTSSAAAEANSSKSASPSVKLETDDSDQKTQASTASPEAKTNEPTVVENGKIISGMTSAATEAEVAQHIELLLGLVSKAPQLLNELFASYPRMSKETQETIQTLFTPLIRSLGPNHPKILDIVENHPDGSEDLVFRVLAILTDKGKLPAALTALIKRLASEKELSPRFMMPIIAEFDKAEITKNLPRILSMLDGKQPGKDVIRSVFQSIVTTPPQSFGSMSTNVPRVRQSELLTPVELLVLLHLSEKEIGLKQTIEAIGICFSMTEAFRPEVLAAFMQQIVDEPNLPTLFLRTVIQAVTTYKSLIPYVSNTLLSRLITKKIWTMPQLWQGFIRCAKTIAPHSFGAVMQLPKDQIKELVTKQPDLRDGLKEYVTKKAGTNRSRIAGLLEVLEG